MKKTLTYLIKIAITLALTGYIASIVSFGELASKMSRLDLFYILALVFLFFIFLLLGALNYYLIVVSLKKIPFPRILSLFSVSLSVGMFTPAYIGELSSTAYLLKKEGIPVSRGLSVTSVDKLVTVGVNGLLSLVGAWFFLPRFKGFLFVLFPVLLAVPFVCIYYRPLRKLVKHHVADRLFPTARDYLEAVVSFFLNYPGLLLLNIFCTLVRAFVGAYMIWIALMALGVHKEIFEVMFVNFTARIAGYLPVTISGLGLLEGSAMALFRGIGVAPETTLLAYLFDRGICTLFGLLVILRLTWKKNTVNAAFQEARTKVSKVNNTPKNTRAGIATTE